jgi:hypothetical protein
MKPTDETIDNVKSIIRYNSYNETVPTTLTQETLIDFIKTDGIQCLLEDESNWGKKANQILVTALKELYELKQSFYSI